MRPTWDTAWRTTTGRKIDDVVAVVRRGRTRAAERARYRVPGSREGKSCPCVAGYTCDRATDRCVAGGPNANAVDASSVDATTGASPPSPRDAAPRDAAEPQCGVHADQRLWCSNRPDHVYAGPDRSTTVVNDLKTTYSWFAAG
jgi:hypothetical protein